MDLAKELRDVRMPNGAIIGLNWAGAAEIERQRDLLERYETTLRQIAASGNSINAHLARTALGDDA